MSGIVTTQNGKIQKRSAPEPSNLAQLLERMRGEIARALPRHITADRMARVTLTALRTNPDLMHSDPASFLACVMQSAQLGLEPNSPLGLAYLIPRRDRDTGGTTCTLQIGYQGMLELARRSGQILSIEADVVYEGDRFLFEKGDNPRIEHVPGDEDDPKKITHAYAIARLKDGGIQRAVLTRRKIERARAANRSPRRSPWDTHFDEMARKTAIRALYKMLPKSAEMAAAAAIDEAPEIGRSQLAAMDATIHDAVRTQGLELPDEAGETPAEGEIVDAAASE